MNRTQRTLGVLAALPLLLAPLGCDKAQDVAAAAQDGLEDAAGTAGDALGNVGDMGKDLLAKSLGDFQPKIAEAIESLKGGTGNLTEGMKEKLSKLTDIQGQLPDLISSLTSGSGDVLSSAMEKAKSLLAEIPKLISSIAGK